MTLTCILLFVNIEDSHPPTSLVVHTKRDCSVITAENMKQSKQQVPPGIEIENIRLILHIEAAGRCWDPAAMQDPSVLNHC